MVSPIADDDALTIYDINVDQDGLYSIFITLTKDGISCVFGDINEYIVDLELFRPDPPIAVDWQQSICSNASTYIPYTITGTNTEYTYEWSGQMMFFQVLLSQDGNTFDH